MRVIGVLAVIFWHIALSSWRSVPVKSPEGITMSIYYGALGGWAVPVFVMISGALFLSRDIPVRKIYGKYIFRIFTAFVFWSFFHAIADYAMKRDIYGAVVHFITGHAHMWFLYMIVGLYMIVPFMKRIAESEFLTKYFLVIAFFFTFLFPEAVNIISLFSEDLSKLADGVINSFQIKFTAGYVGYFLLGYFLNNAQISRRAERIIYFLGIISVIAGILLSVIDAMRANKESAVFYEHLTANNLLGSIAVFIFFKSKFNYPSRIIRALSQYSFGAYLVHYIVIGIVVRFCISPSAFSPVFSVPVISVIVFVISFGISAVLNHIPVLKKYIV